VVEGPALEKRYPAKSGIVGSNPTLSAMKAILAFLRFLGIFIISIVIQVPERCPSWLKEHDWKSCVLPKAVPRVRIPLSPP
jgi:hypothetical protein